ncbi:helix-turn-helix domain-containing protein [Streptomyces sp. NPDC056821]|uniref:helix-turn-helix domain-containing protein n=1 Tax=unclassified Streptomyces TaxID=2593676 RepID=UPI0036B92AAD
MSRPARDHHVSTATATSTDVASSGYQIRRIRHAEPALDLVRPDGSVVIPPAVAGDVLRALVRDLTARVRADGGEVTPGIRRLLYALHMAAQRAEQQADEDRAAPRVEHQSDSGTAPTASATVGTVSVAEAAAALECRPEYVRRLARRGDLAAHRLGRRAWAIDRTSLDHYRHGRHTP